MLACALVQVYVYHQLQLPLTKADGDDLGFFSRENRVQIIQVHMFSVLQEFDLGERGLQEHVDIKLEALMPRVGSVESFHCCKLIGCYTFIHVKKCPRNAVAKSFCGYLQNAYIWNNP